jgi:hypothetical protein
VVSAAFLGLISTASRLVSAKDVIGVNKCFCQPSAYEITLNFDLECADKNIDYPTKAVLDLACAVENHLPVKDPFPVSVSKLMISELDINLNPLKQVNLTQKFASGDMVKFFSTVLEGPVDLQTLPRGLEVIAEGKNAGGQKITNTYVIVFTNRCDTYPVLKVDDQVGWSVFVSCTPVPPSLRKLRCAIGI